MKIMEQMMLSTVRRGLLNLFLLKKQEDDTESERNFEAFWHNMVLFGVGVWSKKVLESSHIDYQLLFSR